MIVTIDPDPGLDEGGRLSINQTEFQNQLTEHELRWRTREIYDAIQSYGVNVRSTEAKPATLKPELLPYRSQKRQRYHSGRDDPDFDPA